MFAEKLRKYVLLDTSKRLKDDRVSLLLSLLVYCLLSFVWKLPKNVSAKAALGMLASSMLVFTLRYSIFDEPTLAAPREGLLYRHVTRRFALQAALATLLFIAAPGAEAVAIERKLLKLTSDTPLSEHDMELVAHYLDLATRWNLPLKRETLVKVRDAVKLSALQAAQHSLARPATALLRYDQDVYRTSPTRKETPPAAREALNRGTQLRLQALQSFQSPESPNYLNAALVAYTEAIAKSEGYPDFQALALILRAHVYLALGNREAAAKDARAAEATGTLNLGPIAALEGEVYALQANDEDARHAIGLLTLALDMNAEHRGMLPHDGLSSYMYRAVAYIRLKEYAKAIPDAERVIELATDYNVVTFRHLGYRLLTVAYLGVSNYEAALRTAKQYTNQEGGWITDQWQQLVEAYPQDPAGVFHTLTETVLGVGKYRFNL